MLVPLLIRERNESSRERFAGIFGFLIANLRTARSTAEMCTKTSLPPRPVEQIHPFTGLIHFTVPVATSPLPFETMRQT
jgi:hypothetical protein